MNNFCLHFGDTIVKKQDLDFINNKAFQDNLVASNIALVRKMALRYLKKFTKTNLELDDLLSAGEEALVNASRKFNPAVGKPFEAYAYTSIKNAFILAHRELQPVYMSDSENTSGKFVHIDDETQGDGLEAQLWIRDNYETEKEELVEVVENMVKHLSDKSQLLYKLRYIDGMTLQEIGTTLRISHQAIAKQLNRMKREMRGHIFRNGYTYGQCA